MARQSLAELNFSEARANFTEVVDRAQRFEIPVIRPRKKSEDYSVLMRGELLKTILDKDQIAQFSTTIYEENDHSTTISVSPFDIVVNGETKQQAIQAAADEVADYAREYMDPLNFPLYSRSLNRRPHLALVVKSLLCNSVDELRDLLGLAEVS